MRVFIGTELPDAAKQAAGQIMQRVRDRVRRLVPRASIRWVEPANLHITLWFIGDLADARLAQFRAAASEPFRTRAFELQFGLPGLFPPAGAPRVLWIGIDSGVEHLRSLHDELQPRMVALGFEPEHRAYAPHLTIARIKDIRRSDAALLRNALDLPVERFAADVGAVTLFRSHTSPTGAQYEPLLRVPLA